jgi:hypothetical protein
MPFNLLPGSKVTTSRLAQSLKQPSDSLSTDAEMQMTLGLKQLDNGIRQRKEGPNDKPLKQNMARTKPHRVHP